MSRDEVDPVDTIPLFADSGHHFEFVAFDQFKSAVDVKPEDVQELCNADDLPWMTSAEHNWVRYRPGREGEGPNARIGFWIALESNVGTEIRGMTYEHEHPIPARPLPTDSERPRTPYAYADVNQIDVKPLDLAISIVGRDGRAVGTLRLPTIQWTKPAMTGWIDVDLIIDFGNTRTVALLVERRPDAARLDAICRPVRFIRRGTSYRPYEHANAVDDPCAIVDSWIVLHETLFADHEPHSKSFQPRVRYIPGLLPRTTVQRMFNQSAQVALVKKMTYMPQMFVELSPALLGGGNGPDGARQVLRETRLHLDPYSFLSSPKRYAWDNDPMGVDGRPFWNAELNRWNPEKEVDTPHELPQLKGPMFLFLDEDGRFWDLDKGQDAPNERPHAAQRPQLKGNATHPKRDSLTWAALTIIETAYRQINAAAYRRGHMLFGPRRLRQILVTFPSGWTTQELRNYREQWQKAVNIFTLGHMTNRALVDDGGDRPRLVTDLDEAVASQLPVIYSEGLRIRETNAWLQLVGRRRDAREPATVRIMNIDIGGGTTDLAIAEYYNSLVDSDGVDLHATILFRNSNTIAGDSLVKRIIERVLLPELRSPLVGDERSNFVRFFSDQLESWKSREPTLPGKLARIVQLAIVPIVHYWLRGMGEGRSKDDRNAAPAPAEMKNHSGEQVVDEAMVQELNNLAKKFIGREVLNTTQPLNYQPRQIVECIREQFAPLFRSYGKLASAFDCDLVFVSGKPSELPEIQKLLQETLPIPPERIQLARGFEVGDWYPISVSNGTITDAKTITVVGAALRQAMTSGLIKGWRLTYEPPENPLSSGNYWGTMPPPDAPEKFWKSPLLTPDESECTRQIFLNQRIGRMRYRSPRLMPDQIYVLRWKRNAVREENNLVLNVRLKRVTDENHAELLEIVSVEGVDRNGQPVTAADVELQLKTLPEDAFWMDSPRFEIHEDD